MSRKDNEKLKLAAFFHPTGHHVAAWHHPDAQIDAGTNIDHYLDLARTAEAAKFDFVFLADTNAVRHGNLDALSRWPQYMVFFEPTTLLAAMASVTSRIGLVATASTSYNEPYNIARRYASLDHISKGRAGWNVVTSGSPDEAPNYSRDEHYEHSVRYERAHEFTRIVRGLWDSWEDDAFVRDRSTGQYFDPDKLHLLNHKGEVFSVRGPLNVARPPQGHPVVVQAGSSEAGLELAAETAEVVFAMETDLERARTFYRGLKGRLARYGRSPESLKIMPGLNAIVGRTEQEAQETYDFLQSKIHPDLGKELLGRALGNIDLSSCDIDKPIPEHIFPKETNTSKSRLAYLRRQWEQGMTLREMYMIHAGARGQRTVLGTAEQIVDQMEEWFEAEAVDGFLVQPSHLPGGLRSFIELVVPELRRRGLFREEYEGPTLRDNLGLARPQNTNSAKPSRLERKI